MISSPTGDKDTAAFDAADKAPLAANLVGGANDGGDRRAAGGGYSKFVVWTKVVLPFLALILVALVIAWPRIQGDDTFQIGFAQVSLSGETEAGMDNARYVGTDENRQPFSVTADLGRILSETDGVVALELPKADLTLKDGTWLVMTANTGRYFQNESMLALKGGVNLFHDTGYEITTEILDVDLKAGGAKGDTPINGHGPFGELKAQGINLVDKGRVIYFTGPAQVILYTPAKGG